MKKIFAVFMMAFAIAAFTTAPAMAGDGEKKDGKSCDKHKRGGHGGHMMHDPDVNVSVKETKNGIVITLTADDKDKVKELHLHGEMMKLKQEMKELKDKD